uniref:Uncharacterized protein n=1 Tax=Rhizophora mucronata TaxID=61149 RepID=A0A2P2IW09_RHIMU
MKEEEQSPALDCEQPENAIYEEPLIHGASELTRMLLLTVSQILCRTCYNGVRYTCVSYLHPFTMMRIKVTSFDDLVII